MSVPTILTAWLALSCVLGPIVGKVIKGRGQ